VAEHTGTSPLADVPSSIPLALEKRAGLVPIDERGGPCHRAGVVDTDGARPVSGSVWIEPDGRAPWLTYAWPFIEMSRRASPWSKKINV